MRTIIFDTETTGLPQRGQPLAAQPQIIEIGAVLVDDRFEHGDPSRLTFYSQLINPGVPIPAIITKITGLQDADLVGHPMFLDVWSGFPRSTDPEDSSKFIEEPGFATLLLGCDRLIAHNAPFDVEMLSNELTRIEIDPATVLPKEIICTVSELNHIFGRRAKMTELYEKLLGKPLEQTHRALDDARALYEICFCTGLV